VIPLSSILWSILSFGPFHLFPLSPPDFNLKPKNHLNTNTDKTSNKQTMADLEAVLADVSYLMAMEKSKSTPAARASKKIILPDPR